MSRLLLWATRLSLDGDSLRNCAEHSSELSHQEMEKLSYLYTTPLVLSGWGVPGGIKPPVLSVCTAPKWTVPLSTSGNLQAEGEVSH